MVRQIEAAGIGRAEIAVRLSLGADGCASMSRFPERCQIRRYDALPYRSIYRIDNGEVIERETDVLPYPDSRARLFVIGVGAR